MLETEFGASLTDRADFIKARLDAAVESSASPQKYFSAAAREAAAARASGAGSGSGSGSGGSAGRRLVPDRPASGGADASGSQPVIDTKESGSGDKASDVASSKAAVRGAIRLAPYAVELRARLRTLTAHACHAVSGRAATGAAEARQGKRDAAAAD